jgi:integrase
LERIMPKRKLTAAAVEKVGAPNKGRIEYFDTVLPGFALRITDKGSKSWVLFYRIGGRQRRLTIGKYPAFELADARTEAREALRLVEKGQDPALVKAEAKRVLQHPDTIEAVVSKFIERHAKPNNKTWREVQLMFRHHVLPDWGKRDIRSITRRDVIDLIDDVTDRTSPVRANRILANVRKLFGWAVERDIIGASPVTGVKPPGKERERDRVLSDQEIRAVWEACGDGEKGIGWPFGPFTRMLLVTAQRRDEVAHMKWADIDFENSNWSLPREITKADRSHDVPLSPLALDILTNIPRIGPFVFMSGREPRLAKGPKPISGFGKAKTVIDRKSGVINWRYHDLRRTAGTNMARHGIPVFTISRVLNHAEGGVTKIYARHSYFAEKRHALDAWAQALGSIVRPGGDNVILMSRKKTDG